MSHELPRSEHLAIAVIALPGSMHVQFLMLL
jgi:hypothetical protein